MAGERPVGGLDLEGPDHAGVAEVLHTGVLRDATRRGADAGATRAVGLDDAVLVEDVEGRQRGAAGERVAGVGVRVEEAAGQVIVVERLVDRIARHYHRQRQVAAGDAFRQAQEVRRDARLLVREKRAGAAKAGHDLIGDEMHVVAVANLARPAQVLGVVHRHAGCTLHQGLDDQRGGFPAVALEVAFQPGGAAHGVIARRFPLLRKAPVGARDLAARHDQRGIGVLEQAQVGNRQRAERLAVIAAGQADETGLDGAAAVAPVVEAHFQCDLDRGGAVARVKTVAKRAAGSPSQTLGKLHHRLMAEAGEQHVLELAELVAKRRVDARIAVAEQVYPPRADGVEVTMAVEVVEPAARRARDRHQRQRFVLLHLGARMPYGTQAAL